MGFNNDGVSAIAARLAGYPQHPIPIWVSIGKSAATKLEDAPIEYYELTHAVWEFADVIEVNVTSPNTPGLRNLLEQKPLSNILQAVQSANHERAGEGMGKPIVLKLSPDSSESALYQQIEVALSNGVNGFTATNTTVRRGPFSLASGNALTSEAGGLSGRPLYNFALDAVRFVHRATNGLTPIVAAGGIGSADDAKRMVDSGAALVQIFTGLVYNGPYFVRTLARKLK